MKGLAASPNDAAECAGCKPDGKVLRMAALQRAASHADANARAAALFATLEADAKGASLQARSLRLFQTLPAYAALPGLWRQHGSQHGLVLQSLRQ